MKKVTGHVQIKNNKYYAVLNMYDESGKRIKRWINLDLEGAKSKKREANLRFETLIQKYSLEDFYLQRTKSTKEIERDRISRMNVYEYTKMWLEQHRANISNITYQGYRQQIEGRIRKFFNNDNYKLKDITGEDLNEFYSKIAADNCKGSTAVHYHSLMHKAFKSAVKRMIIRFNPCEQADRPRIAQFIPSYYNQNEVKKLLDVVGNDPLRIVIILTSYYGLRRSEVLGIKWDAIDFENKVIRISHKVTTETIDEKTAIKGYDKMKNKSSYRTLPLLATIEKELLAEKAKQEKMKKLMGKAYSKKYSEYVCVDNLGELFRPNYVTDHFEIILKQKSLKKIRFHDLRHSCASILLANSVPMKMIQEWLGHSNISTTADIYAHTDAKSKELSGDVIEKALSSA